mmetsp:Transcript_32114/g.78260  ORF Transcript_32114/g.78260 Transcript_32114/m.78260 type:complete len:203 (+) Transcript_32114:366-974(+)
MCCIVHVLRHITSVFMPSKNTDQSSMNSIRISTTVPRSISTSMDPKSSSLGSITWSGIHSVGLSERPFTLGCNSRQCTSRCLSYHHGRSMIFVVGSLHGSVSQRRCQRPVLHMFVYRPWRRRQVRKVCCLTSRSLITSQRTCCYPSNDSSNGISSNSLDRIGASRRRTTPRHLNRRYLQVLSWRSSPPIYSVVLEEGMIMKA